MKIIIFKSANAEITNISKFELDKKKNNKITNFLINIIMFFAKKAVFLEALKLAF